MLNIYLLSSIHFGVLMSDTKLNYKIYLDPVNKYLLKSIYLYTYK